MLYKNPVQYYDPSFLQIENQQIENQQMIRALRKKSVVHWTQGDNDVRIMEQILATSVSSAHPLIAIV